MAVGYRIYFLYAYVKHTDPGLNKYSICTGAVCACLAVVNTVLTREKKSYMQGEQVPIGQTRGGVNVKPGPHVGQLIQMELLTALSKLLKCECGDPISILHLQGDRYDSLIRGTCLLLHSIRIREELKRDHSFAHYHPARTLWDFCNTVFKNIKYHVSTLLGHADLPNKIIDRGWDENSPRLGHVIAIIQGLADLIVIRFILDSHIKLGEKVIAKEALNMSLLILERSV
jgi:hypothetical protein